MQKVKFGQMFNSCDRGREPYWHHCIYVLLLTYHWLIAKYFADPATTPRKPSLKIKTRILKKKKILSRNIRTYMWQGK